MTDQHLLVLKNIRWRRNRQSKPLFCTLLDGDYEVIVLPAMGLDRLYADVKTVVDTFHDELTSDMFRGKFKVVCFAIPESSKYAAENMKAFRERFEDPGLHRVSSC